MAAWPEKPAPGHRARRATGAAVGAATALLEGCIPTGAGRIMVFTGGPCTVGPGMTVGTNLEETLRTHQVLFPSAPRVETDLALMQS